MKTIIIFIFGLSLSFSALASSDYERDYKVVKEAVSKHLSELSLIMDQGAYLKLLEGHIQGDQVLEKQISKKIKIDSDHISILENELTTKAVEILKLHNGIDLISP